MGTGTIGQFLISGGSTGAPNWKSIIIYDSGWFYAARKTTYNNNNTPLSINMDNVPSVQVLFSDTTSYSPIHDITGQALNSSYSQSYAIYFTGTSFTLRTGNDNCAIFWDGSSYTSRTAGYYRIILRQW